MPVSLMSRSPWLRYPRRPYLTGVRLPDQHGDLLAVAEGLLEYDLRLQEWRNRHILLVYRTIGVGTPSLKGKHSELLERGLQIGRAHV